MNFRCPLCGGELVECKGDTLHPGDEKFGVTLYCSLRECPAQEVMGHGDKVRDAFETIMHKYGKKKD